MSLYFFFYYYYYYIGVGGTIFKQDYIWHVFPFLIDFCLDFCFIFVSPELSSGRDLVIQMSVRRVPSAVRCPPSMVFCPEHISGTV